MARPVNLVRPGPIPFAATGLGRGWESGALMTITLILLSFGLVTLYSASSMLAQRQGLPEYSYVVRQAAGAAIGLAALAACARMPYTWWRTLAWPMVVISWLLLMLLLLPGAEAIAPKINGARRWLDVGVRFQPSELAKISVVVWTAALAVKKQEEFRSLSRGLLPFVLIWGLVLVPIMLEPDLSTAALIGLLATLIVFAAGGRVGHFVLLFLLYVPFLWKEFTVGFRIRRILSFLDPSFDPEGVGFQVRQSLIAIGSGGAVGAGFGGGRQKFGFLPEAHNDFIFALIGEEWGFAGVTFIVCLYMALILVGFRIARRAPDLFGELLAIGFTSLIALHAILHMAVGLNLLPTTGLPLPLVSFGRSNLVITLVAVGILLSVARESTGGRASRA